MAGAEGANLKGWQVYFNNVTVKGRRNVSANFSIKIFVHLLVVCPLLGVSGTTSEFDS